MVTLTLDLKNDLINPSLKDFPLLYIRTSTVLGRKGGEPVPHEHSLLVHLYW